MVPLPDVLSIIIDNRGRTVPTALTGIPLIATDCIKENALYPASQNLRYVAQETYDSWFRGHPEPGDVILVNKGTPGRVCQVPDPIEFCIAQDMVALRANPKVVSADYLLAALRSQEFKEQVESLHVGTMIPHLKKGDFPHLRIPLPPLRIQEAIGRLYCDISRKIESDNQMNRTLEEAASALFRSWFVDFDPVVAKAAARPPAHLRPTLAALFPDSFQDCELGPIPKGWQVRPLGAVLDVKHGYAFAGEFFTDEPVGDILLTPGNFAIGGGFKDSKLKYYSGKVPEEYVLKQGDLLLTMTDLSKTSDTLGYPALIPPASSMHRYLHNQRLGKVIVRAGEAVSPLFLYQVFRSDAYRNEILASATGTTVMHTAPVRIMAYQCVFAPVEVLKAFDEIVIPWYDMIHHNQAESQTLAALRDTLLPKLLSGEVRVKEAEKLVEART